MANFFITNAFHLILKNIEYTIKTKSSIMKLFYLLKSLEVKISTGNIYKMLNSLLFHFEGQIKILKDS